MPIDLNEFEEHYQKEIATAEKEDRKQRDEAYQYEKKKKHIALLKSK